MRVVGCLFAACLVLCAGCGGDDDNDDAATPPPAAPPAAARELSDRQFVSTAVEGHDLVDATTITLAFPSPGDLTVQAGCNTIRTGFEVDDDVIVVGDVQATLIGCSPELQAQDDWIVSFLESAPMFTLDGDTLTLTGDDATITLREQA